MKFLIAVFPFLLLSPVPPKGQAARERPQCKGNPELVGECFTLRGRLTLGNGTPTFRIWRVGTNRILGVHQTLSEDEAEVYWMPESLVKKAGFDVAIFGDFEVCPLSRGKPGEMQSVCVEKVSNMVARNRSQSAKH